MNQPRILIYAGPNGAGKTTFAREILPREAGCPVFLNADLIAAGLSPFQPESAAMKAGRLMLEAMNEHLSRRESFAFETTLSGLSYAREIPRWRSEGYWVELVFLSLPNADTAVARVATRVSQGGHDIPEPVIRRRFQAGVHNFREVYRSLVDEWRLYDNGAPIPILLEEGRMTDFEAHEGTPDSSRPPSIDPLPALIRAAERARQIALQTGTPLVRAYDGKVVYEWPEPDPPAQGSSSTA